MTFQFEVSKVNFWHRFGPFQSFSISSSPILKIKWLGLHTHLCQQREMIEMHF